MLPPTATASPPPPPTPVAVPIPIPAVVVLLLVVAPACATPLSALTLRRELATDVGPIAIRSLPTDGTADPTRVARALETATPKIHVWGGLEVPVDLDLMPTHGDLEAAVHRWGYGWLRAWAQYDDVMLQSPGTWARDDADVAELLAHELTHCVMYQKSATREDWAKKAIPLWFREGMATWTAEQGYRWMTLEDLARVYEHGKGHDPISDAEAMYQHESGAVYAAAHYAFTFLVKRYGTDAVERVMAAMKQGARFDAAFTKGVGLSPSTFIAEFRRFVTWRGFRGSGAPLHPQ